MDSTEQTKTGNLIIEGNLTTGSFKMAAGAGADKVLTTDASGVASWQTPAAGGLYCDNDNDGHYAKNLLLSCPGSSSETAGDDCDDFCPTCYPTSTSSTDYADGYDQNCNGTVDESEAIQIITLCSITDTYEESCTSFCTKHALECFSDSYATCDLSYGSCERSQALTGWATNYRCDCGITSYIYY